VISKDFQRGRDAMSTSQIVAVIADPSLVAAKRALLGIRQHPRCRNFAAS
jgi:hypothetical protein